MSKGRFLMGLLAGAAAGALLGVLFAPDKGTETRKKISTKGQDLADAATLRFNEMMSGIDDKLEKLKQEINDLKSSKT